MEEGATGGCSGRLPHGPLTIDTLATTWSGVEGVPARQTHLEYTYE